MSTLKDKALQAATRYVEHRGYDVIDVAYPLPGGEQIDIVAKDGDALAFIDVKARRDSAKGFPESDTSNRAREEREMAAIRWLQNGSEEYTDIPIRFDVISLVVIGEHRAIIRHHINAFGMSPAKVAAPATDRQSEDMLPDLSCATA